MTVPLLQKFPQIMSGWQFPQWSYGHTQMPAYYPYPGPYPGQQPPYPAPPQPRPPQPRPPAPAPSVKVETGVKTEAAAGSTTTIKKEAVITKPQPPGPTPAAPTPEEGEIVEKSVLGILRGRNPVTFGGFSRISPLNNRI